MHKFEICAKLKQKALKISLKFSCWEQLGKTGKDFEKF